MDVFQLIQSAKRLLACFILAFLSVAGFILLILLHDDNSERYAYSTGSPISETV
jgi:hypothetical protein